MHVLPVFPTISDIVFHFLQFTFHVPCPRVFFAKLFDTGFEQILPSIGPMSQTAFLSPDQRNHFAFVLLAKGTQVFQACFNRRRDQRLSSNEDEGGDARSEY